MVYIDCAENRCGRMIMCHLIADSENELHNFAAMIGLKRHWFQAGSTPHYDIGRGKKHLALAFGAIELNRRETVKLIQRLREERRMPAALKAAEKE